MRWWWTFFPPSCWISAAPRADGSRERGPRGWKLFDYSRSSSGGFSASDSRFDEVVTLLCAIFSLPYNQERERAPRTRGGRWRELWRRGSFDDDTAATPTACRPSMDGLKRLWPFFFLWLYLFFFLFPPSLSLILPPALCCARVITSLYNNNNNNPAFFMNSVSRLLSSTAQHRKLA